MSAAASGVPARPEAGSARDDEEQGHPRRWLIFAVVSLGAFMAQLDLFIVNIAFPAIGHDFSGAGTDSLQWILDAYAIVFAACLVPAGRLGDLIGRRRLFEIGIALFAVASAGCAAAPDVAVLVGARVIQAIGAALVIPASLGLLLHAFAPRERAGATGAWAAVGAIAAASGPPLGGLLVLVSWRLIFVINLPLAAVALASTRRIVAEVRHPDLGGRPDVPGIVLLVAGIGLVVLCIVKGAAWGWASVQFIGGLLVAAALLTAFVRRCARHPAPVIELSLLALRPFAVANGVMLVFYVGFGATLLAIVLFLTVIWRESTPLAGIMFATSPGTVVLLTWRVRGVVRRWGADVATVIGCLAFAGGAAWLVWRATEAHHFVRDLLPALILIGVGVAFTQTTLYGVIAEVLPPARFGTGSGVLNMSRQIAIALGVAILVAILGPTVTVAGFHRMFELIVVLDLIAAGMALALPGRSGQGATANARIPGDLGASKRSSAS